MKKSNDEILSIICDVWNIIIYPNKYFQQKINFKENHKSNYFQHIQKYFCDTEVIINLTQKGETDFYTNFSNAISFLQSIYVQQDLIEELLYIFKCKSTKGELKKDSNYSINREIRNELIGHPIRKSKKGNKLISSTIFSNSQNDSNIAYFKYYENENYKAEHIEISRELILNRHTKFVNIYLTEILNSAKRITKLYKKQLIKLDKSVESIPFENLTQRVEHIFGSMYKCSIIPKPVILVEINKRRTENIRYELAIQDFYSDLKKGIKDNINIANKILELPEEKFNEDFESEFQKSIEKQHGNECFIYELSKLVDKDYLSFQLLKARLSEKPELIQEIRFLEENQNKTLEYYTSLNYLRRLLK